MGHEWYGLGGLWSVRRVTDPRPWWSCCVCLSPATNSHQRPRLLPADRCCHALTCTTPSRQPSVLIHSGSVVAPGTVVPPATLYAGSPAVRVRALSDEELSSSAAAVAELGRLSLVHAAEGVPPDVAAALGVPTSSAPKTAIA